MVLAPTNKQKPKPHHKKATGSHQRQGKDFHKAYWPYLPMLLIAGLGLFANSWLHTSTRDVLGYATDVSSVSMLNESNARRASAYEAPLSLNQKLTDAAQAKAEDMVTRDYWAHMNPDGKQPWQFVAATGYQYQKAGENLAYGFGSSQETVAAWMNSAEHRANLLNTQYREVGFGIASSPNYNGQGPETVIVAMYAMPGSSAFTIKASVPAGDENVGAVAQPITAQKVSRLQTISTYGGPWNIAVLALIAVGLVLLLTRHTLAWKRVLVESEQFVLHHKFLDIVVVGLITFLAIISQTSGFIQ